MAEKQDVEYKLIPIEPSENKTVSDEVGLNELISLLWNSRKILIRFFIAGVILGLLVVILSPKEFVSTATLMPEYSTEAQSGSASRLLAQYGGLLGINSGTYNSTSNAIRVDLYPKIVSSLTFQLELANHPFYFADYDTVATLMDYYQEIKEPSFGQLLAEYTLGLPGKIIGLFKSSEAIADGSVNQNEDILILTNSELEIIQNLQSRVYVTLNDESGIITVSAKMRDPKLAASMAEFTINALTDYLIDYRTEKVNIDLEFTEEQMVNAKERFEIAQLDLADFMDSNQGTKSERAKIQEKLLQSEYNIAFNVYNTLTQQFEEAKLKVQEETPVFKVLQPVLVPVRDASSGVLTLALYVFLSLIFGGAYIAYKTKLQTTELE